jgi:O-antigen ligase
MLKRDSPFAAPVPSSNPRQSAPVNAPSAVTPVAAENRNGPLGILLGFYVLTLTVPIAELLIVYWHIHIPIVPIIDLALTAGLIFTGRIGAFWRTPLAKPWMALLVLTVIAAGLGDYPGRSVPFTIEYGLRFHILPFYCCAIAISTKNVRQALSWIGIGSFILLFLCLAYGKIEDGRLGIPNTDMANPNDLGLGILTTMTGLLVVKSRFSRALAVLASPVFVYEVLQTGSRACLVTLMALSAVLFILVPGRTKIILAALVPIAAAIVLSVLPSVTVARLMLLVDPSRAQSGDVQLQSAMESQAARAELQERAVQLAMRHPLFGVGALMFQDAVEEMVRSQTGEKSGWQGAHNTYLEVAAENGIPAMLLYIFCLLICLRLNYRAYKTCRGSPELKDAAMQSLALILFTITWAVCTGFSNNAYAPALCVLVGLSAANSLALERERKAVLKTPATPRAVFRRPPVQQTARVR